MWMLLAACTDREPVDTAPPSLESPLAAEVVADFDVLNVKRLIDELGQDSYAGRTPGSIGHAAGLDWLEAEVATVGLQPVGDNGGFRQTFSLSLSGRYAPNVDGVIEEVSVNEGVNLAGLVPGVGDRSDELIVVMAHHDHLGTTQDGEVFNGAYDDLSGVGILLEIARLYADHGVQPNRSILFLITDAEEGGLRGAEAWVESAPWDLDHVVAAFSVDPMGRPMLPDTWPLVLLGMERSPELMALWRDMARSWSDSPVHFVNRSAIPIFASDQDPFWDAPQPMAAAWVTSPGFTWYHTTGDEPQTIDYRTVQDHGRFLAQALLYMANSSDTWMDRGEQNPVAADALDAVELLDTVLSSDALTDIEAAQTRALQRDFQELHEQGDAMDPDDARPIITEAMLFIMQDLAQAHPGVVPPPMPD